MALQWMILTYVVAAEAAIALLLTLSFPKLLRSRIVSLVSLIVQPCMFIVPFAAFQLLDIYWKNEHRLMCTGEVCTASERDRYEKSIYKAQRNHAFFTGASIASASTISRSRAWKKLRRDTRKSSLPDLNASSLTTVDKILSVIVLNPSLELVCVSPLFVFLQFCGN
ncbi:hypothetical protein AKJ16_DCAP13150 [Drosera capensis]